MRATELMVMLGVLGIGGTVVYLLAKKPATTPGTDTPPPVVSTVYAASTGTGSSGNQTNTNEYDAIIGIAGAVGGVVSSGFKEGGFFSNLFSSDEEKNASHATTGSGLVAPGETYYNQH